MMPRKILIETSKMIRHGKIVRQMIRHSKSIITIEADLTALMGTDPIVLM